jgi:uncharacterized membrane protein
MALTYQPFSQTPEIERLSEELHRNIPDSERVLSGALGTALVAAGVSRSGLTRWALVLAGGALLRRALTGNCPVYSRLDLDKRHGRSGVPGNRGTRIESSVDIRCDARRLFEFWQNLEQLPRVMRHVKSVELRSGKRSHWKVAGPAGQSFQWDAEIINGEPDRMIAWQSLPGASVSNAGSVWFEPRGNGVTRVKVALEFDPPAGSLGVAVAGWLGHSPEKDLGEDLARFKEFAETELAGRPLEV